MTERQGDRRRAAAFFQSFSDETGPEVSLLNLVDLILVFAVGLLLSIVSYHGLQELLLGRRDVTIVKDPGKPEMEILIKKANKIERMKLTKEKLSGEGTRIGVAYRLKSGEIVYVPDVE